jgi:hypothetical protein
VLYQAEGDADAHMSESNRMGYEILPNKYFYRYQPPPPAKELLEEF